VWASFFNHQRIDVQPFNELGSATYNRFWIPNPGAGCAASNPCINLCEQAFENCSDGPRCLAERTRCLAACSTATPPGGTTPVPSSGGER
jgi:hypothetical protein